VGPGATLNESSIRRSVCRSVEVDLLGLFLHVKLHVMYWHVEMAMARLWNLHLHVQKPSYSRWRGNNNHPFATELARFVSTLGSTDTGT
jgi:hypothetical protein